MTQQTKRRKGAKENAQEMHIDSEKHRFIYTGIPSKQKPKAMIYTATCLKQTSYADICLSMCFYVSLYISPLPPSLLFPHS